MTERTEVAHIIRDGRWPDGMSFRDRMWVRMEALKWRWKLWHENRGRHDED